VVSRAIRSDVFSRALFDAFPSPVFVVDEDVRLLDMNQAAAALIDGDSEDALLLLCGGALRCVHCQGGPERCGATEECEACLVRGSVASCFGDGKVVRNGAKLRLARKDGVSDLDLWVTVAPLVVDGCQLAVLILEDVSELVRLQGLLPICMHCKKVRDDEEYWGSLEQYLSDHTDILFSHAICPVCLKEHYSDL